MSFFSNLPKKTLPASLLFAICYLLFAGSALSAEPFPPFSIEGNPPEDYYFDEIFPLFTYIRPPTFQVFENEDRSRGYEALEICTGDHALDTRDPYCNNNGDACTGGIVNICYKDTGSFAYPAKSGSGSCDYYEDIDPEFPDAYREGKCSYRAKPSVTRTIMGTDFSANDTPDELKTSSFVYPKLQDEAARYSNQGDPANPISYGSHFLAYNLCERATHQLLVVARAKQTKTTVTTTGEWPLGWVDWGYTTQKNGNNYKTLLQIYDSLPGSISGAAQIIIEGIDDYYLNSAGIEVMSDISGPKKEFCQTYTSAAAEGEQWASDLSLAPLYSPSFRQGYARSSICVWDICCPGLRCPLDSGLNEKEGNSRSLYYDTSISQAFGGALDDLLFNYPLKEGAEIFQNIATNNPLIRFLTSASDQAIPSAIAARLNQEMKDDQCFQLRTNPLRWIDFGYIFDYLENYKYLDPEEKCPGYDIQGELTKEEGGAFATQSLISQIISLLWNRPVDDVDPVKTHLITVPDAMGQSISEIQNHMYYTQDTLIEIERQQEYNSSLSNIVDDQEGYLLAGKYGPVASSKRRLAHFSCSSSEYSSPQGTSILDYALGTRIGCSNLGSPLEDLEDGWNCTPTTAIDLANEKTINVESGSLYAQQIYSWCSSKEENAFELCYKDVMNQADVAGVNPIFALTIWLHESAASSYICGRELRDSSVEDFGIHTDPNTPDENFQAQLTKFIGLPSADSYALCKQDMPNFIAKFWFGDCFDDLDSSKQAQVHSYIEELVVIWNRLLIDSGDHPFPTWPN